MLQYILECIAFQLLFLIIYDLFLKRETFLQWNRLYLIGTYILSMVLPWVKIEAMKAAVPKAFQEYPEFLWGMNDAAVVLAAEQTGFLHISWEYMLLFGGMFIAALFFAFKLYQIYALKQQGEVHYFKDFTRIVISNSAIAFSFFRSIFLGDKVLAKEHQNILNHELVHIKQRHTYDLLFFELMRIVAWFNPLVYVYQSRVSELHEFIADAQVAKTNRKEQYELLLSEVFQTQNISFINQFFKSSLIKKRIVMLQKTKSKQIWKLKYLLLVPMVLGMLAYTSCNLNKSSEQDAIKMIVDDIDKMSKNEEEELFNILKAFSDNGGDWEYILKDANSSIIYNSSSNDSYIKFDGHDEKIKATMIIQGGSVGKGSVVFEDANGVTVPFAAVDEVPIFVGCENETDKRVCFQENMQNHIRNNFRYPKEAQEKGIQGRVSILLTIDKEGNVTNIRKRGPDALLEVEADRIMKTLPKMKPGKHNGEEVSVLYSIPINFRLETDEIVSVVKNYDNGIDVPFAVIDEVPVFPGCENEADPRACFNTMIQKHISKNFRYPQEAQEKGIQGRVSVMFTIDEQGNVTNIRKRGPDALLEEEVDRIISRLPTMQPGKQKGVAVRVPFSIPITFKLEQSNFSNFSNKIVAEESEGLTNNLFNGIYEGVIPFSKVDEAPIFPDCENSSNTASCFQESIRKHIRKHFNYPKEAQEKGIQGRVAVLFIIAKDGSIKGVKTKGPDKTLEVEAARIIARLPKMMPAKHKGAVSEVAFSVPITFKLK